MKLDLYRDPSNDVCTLGKLFVNAEYECVTLEDPVREKKIHGKTAIPAGKYEVVLSLSLRFKRVLPEILKVPNFVGVRIHPGNKAEDTEGCILVGTVAEGNMILSSRKAFDRLYAKLDLEDDDPDGIWLEIHDAPKPA